MNLSNVSDDGSRDILPGIARSGILTGSNVPLPRAALKKLLLTSAVPETLESWGNMKWGLSRPDMWQLLQLSPAFAACPPSNVGVLNNARPYCTEAGLVPLAKQLIGWLLSVSNSAPFSVQTKERANGKASGSADAASAAPDNKPSQSKSLS